MIGRSFGSVNVARTQLRDACAGLRSRREWLGSCSQCKMAVLKLGVFLRLPMTFEPPAPGNDRLRSTCAARIRADDSVSGARACGCADGQRRAVAWDGACNHCRHDDVKSRHWKSNLMAVRA